MSKQMSLFSAFSYTQFSAEEKETLLTNPQAGAMMAVYAVSDLFAHLEKQISFRSELVRLREATPNPQEDMRYWLHFIQRHPYIRQLKLDDEAIYLYNKAEFLLTVAHLVAWNDINNARFMFGEKLPNTTSTRARPRVRENIPNW